MVDTTASSKFSTSASRDWLHRTERHRTPAEAHPTRVGLAVGTLRYMSPEQACAEPLTARPMFLACVVLSEMATGAHPFAGAGAASDAALVTAILTGQAEVPSASNTTLPAEFDSLILRMLDKTPGLRPRADEVERVLSELSAQTPRDTSLTPAQIIQPSQRHSVGREVERRALHDALLEALGGRGLLLAVIGEPGIGKTTLVEDFLAELGGSNSPCRVTRGRCSERLAGTEAYLPILEALDGLTSGSGSISTIALMKRLAPSWYLQIAPVSAVGSSDAVALGSVQASSQERMKRELSAFLSALSASAPIVVFLDDLHWADLSTVDVLAYVCARLETARLLIVATLRPAELLLGRHPFAQLKLDLQARGRCRELLLEFLTPDHVEEYLRLEFPGHVFPWSFAQLIHAKTEGSPLFMADLLRYLRTRGAFVEEGGRWTLGTPLAAIEHELPESIRAMIQRKIEQLGESDRRLLSAASVQGYQFDSAVVSDLTSMDPADVEERLETLEHVYGLVRRAREQELPNGTLNVRYRFVHALYQNALYAGLQPTRRVSLSARAAQALLVHHADRGADIAAELALLFEAARDPRRAVDHLLVAARNATRVFASQEAVALSRRALRLLAERPDTRERTEQELMLQGTYATALGAIEGLGSPEVGRAAARAYELWQRLDAPPELAAVLGGLWGYYIVAGRLDVAVQIGEKLLQLAEDSGERSLRVSAHNALALTLHHLGDHAQALTHFERGLAAYGLDLGPVFMNFTLEPGVNLASEYARTLWVVGYPDRALRQLDAALSLSELVPHPEARSFVRVFAAFVHHFCGDVSNTLLYTDQVIAIARERDIATTLAWAMVLHGWALVVQGRADEGLSEIRESLAGQLAAGSLIARPQFLAIFADACCHAGRQEDALAATSEGLACSAVTSDHYWDSELMRLRGDALQQLHSDPLEIDACFQRAISDARARGARSLELRAATSAARVRSPRAERRQAYDTLSGIYGWFTEGFETADLIDARSVLDSLA